MRWRSEPTARARIWKPFSYRTRPQATTSLPRGSPIASSGPVASHHAGSMPAGTRFTLSGSISNPPVISRTMSRVPAITRRDRNACHHSTLFTSVGYGTEVRKPVSGPQKPTPQSFPIVRRYAEEPGQKLTPQIVQVNGNINDPRGSGGTCFGDSGGPSFVGGYVVTVTSYGYTDNCRYLGGLQRVDIGVAQEWLASFGVVPAA